MADVYRALDDETRRLILDELVRQDGQTLFALCAFSPPSMVSARPGRRYPNISPCWRAPVS